MQRVRRKQQTEDEVAFPSSHHRTYLNGIHDHIAGTRDVGHDGFGQVGAVGVGAPSGLSPFNVKAADPGARRREDQERGICGEHGCSRIHCAHRERMVLGKRSQAVRSCSQRGSVHRRAESKYVPIDWSSVPPDRRVSHLGTKPPVPFKPVKRLCSPSQPASRDSWAR